MKFNKVMNNIIYAIRISAILLFFFFIVMALMSSNVHAENNHLLWAILSYLVSATELEFLDE